ncbi:hypothetical protein LHP98_07900 [Rhodobacter sp. Har01]|uniref:hypothetical protein n=1 Tax=Rhodobacter sp. Har01 TaxID=2883999 RepID=UPI001D076C01|nr:hypothetical protein [Rhodobacter sp. Har01]MCB6178051.1 hypothetical protein [Rhodobacter sp. Har01]
MIRKRSMIRAVALLGVALAAGHLVQTMNAERQAETDAPAKPAKVESGAAEKASADKLAEAALPAGAALVAATDAPAAVDTPPVAPVLAGMVASSAPAPEAAAQPVVAAEVKELPAPAGADVAPEVPVQVAADPVQPVAKPEPAPVIVTQAESCATDLGLAVGPNAMISVSISAPCRGGERVVLRHAGLTVAEALGPDGKLAFSLPALGAEGEVSVLFADASVLRDAVPVPGMGGVRRFAVQWMADDAFQLHAYENGAVFGTPGDVSASNRNSPNGGSLVTLGNPALDLPMMAEVYTWPADGSSYAEPVVEAAVTEMTCGRDLLGETIHLREGAVEVTDLTVSMPGCEAVGDILVLNNLVPDVTLAAVN